MKPFTFYRSLIRRIRFVVRGYQLEYIKSVSLGFGTPKAMRTTHTASSAVLK